MRIAILIDELIPGSAPKTIKHTTEGLNRLGHQAEAVLIIGTIFKKRPFWDLRIPGFQFFSLHHILSFFFAFKLPKYDLVIANAITSIPVAWALKLFRRTPYIFYIHCNPNLYLLDKLAIKWAKCSLASGVYHRNQFAQRCNKNIRILIPGCIPNEEFVTYDKREKAVISFDRWDKGNNPLRLLPILVALNMKGFKIRIAGYWLDEKVRKKFEAIKEIEVLGELSEEDIKNLCSKSMLHIHPIREAFGSSTLEAAGCGCCILIPENSGVSELFPNTTFFPSDIKKAEAQGRMNWEIAQSYTWDNYVENLQEIICAI